MGVRYTVSAKRRFTTEKGPKLLSFDDLKNKKGIAFSRAHIYRLINKRKFPMAVRIGEARVAFLESEIDAWIDERIAERDAVA
jgi:prophage regulatory protein